VNALQHSGFAGQVAGEYRDPYRGLRSAVVFASYKIGAVSAADGLLTDTELDEWG